MTDSVSNRDVLRTIGMTTTGMFSLILLIFSATNNSCIGSQLWMDKKCKFTGWGVVVCLAAISLGMSLISAARASNTRSCCKTQAVCFFGYSKELVKSGTQQELRQPLLVGGQQEAPLGRGRQVIAEAKRSALNNPSTRASEANLEQQIRPQQTRSNLFPHVRPRSKSIGDSPLYVELVLR